MELLPSGHIALSDSSSGAFPFFSMTSPSVSTRSAGSRVSTRTRLQEASSSDQMAQISNGRRRRNQIYNISCQGDNAAGCKTEEQDRVTASMQASFFEVSALRDIIVGKQDRVVYRRTHLDTADNNVAHVDHIHALHIRNCHVDEDGNPDHNHDRDQN